MHDLPLPLSRYDLVKVNGETIYDAKDDLDPAAPADGYVRAEGYDPWYEQDRCFVEDVRDAKRLMGEEPSGGARFQVRQDSPCSKYGLTY